ncbi:hypothetical protein TWF281_003689 [Arthrobotrys megalospora]
MVFSQRWCFWATALIGTAKSQTIFTEFKTSSTSITIYTTVRPTSTIVSSCGSSNYQNPWLPLCNQVTWAPIDTVGSGADGFNHSSPGSTKSLQPIEQASGNQNLGNQGDGNQDIESIESSLSGGDPDLSSASSIANLAQLSTLNKLHHGTTIPTASVSVTPYPSPFPIGGRDRLRNMAVQLSPGNMVIFRAAPDSPQKFINDEAGYIRPVSNPDLVLYIHYNSSANSSSQVGGPASNSTVLQNVRAKAQGSTDPYDIENTFTVREGGIQLRGTSGHAEYRFYIGDYEEGDEEYKDGVLKLLAAPISELVNVEKYQVEEVILLPFIVRSAGAQNGAADSESDTTNQSNNGSDTAATDAIGAGTLGTGTKAAAGTLTSSIPDVYEVITSSSLVPFCSEYLSHITMIHTETQAHHLVHSESTHVSVVPEASIKTGTTSTTTKTIESGISTKPWPTISSAVGHNSPEPGFHGGSNTAIDFEGGITNLRKYPLRRHLKREFDIPDALSLYNPSQIMSGCSEVIYQLHHSTSTAERSTHTSDTTVTITSTSIFTVHVNHIETSTTTIPSTTITPTPMSGKILMYNRGHYSTSPGTLSAHYLAPTTTYASMTPETAAAELVRTSSQNSLFHLDEFGRLYSVHPYTGVTFYWAEKVRSGGHGEIAQLKIGDYALIKAQDIDGYVLNFVAFWIEEDGRVYIDELYANGNAEEVEHMNGWEFIWCYDRSGTLWNYNTALRHKDEPNSELTETLLSRDIDLDGCTPQTLTFEKLDGETPADDIIYMDILKRQNQTEDMGLREES